MTGGARAASAATVIRKCRAELRARGSNVLRELLAASGSAEEWRHYPPGDGFDPVSHAQYFYHQHARSTGAAGSGQEIGHFHLFLRAEGMPPGTQPLLLPEAAIAKEHLPTPPQAAPSKRSARDEVSHLVAVAIDSSGEPVRLFTTNRWVTGETWYRAEDVIRMIECFSLDAAEPVGLVNLWLTGMVRLYQPEIAMLLRERDRMVMDPIRRRRRVDVFEDPRLEITSSLAIDLEVQLAMVDRLAPGHAPAHQPPALPRIPRLAEGWGS